MAIAYDNSGKGTTAGTTITVSATVSASATVLIVAEIHATANVSSITANGVALTNVTSLGSPSWPQSMWILVSPPTGTYNIVVTYSGSSSLSNMMWASYTGTATTQPDNSATGVTVVNPGSSFSVGLTTVASNCWTVAFFNVETGSDNITAGTGTTMRQVLNGASALSEILLGDSNGTVSGSTSMGITFGNTITRVNGQIISLKPPIVGPANVKTWDGVTQSSGIKTYNDVAVASVKTVIGVA